MPEISIIVPVYKVESYLRRCLDSILIQTFKCFELILIDDGSLDNSGAICDEYAKKDERIIVIHQNNQGQAKARNVALDWVFANSDSKYITFIDSDDWVHPSYLELLYKTSQRYKTNISQCLHIVTDGTIELPQIEEKISVISIEKQYTDWYSAFVWGKLYFKSVWKDVRFPEGQIYEDVAIWYKILFNQDNIGLVEEVLYYYFINVDGTVRSDWTSAKLKQVDAWDEQIEFLSKYGNQVLLECAAGHLLDILRSQQIKVSESKAISKFEKVKYTLFLRQRLRNAIFRFRKTSYYKEKRIWFIEGAYPMIAWLYWALMRIKKNFQRKKE